MREREGERCAHRGTHGLDGRRIQGSSTEDLHSVAGYCNINANVGLTMCPIANRMALFWHLVTKLMLICVCGLVGRKKCSVCEISECEQLNKLKKKKKSALTSSSK